MFRSATFKLTRWYLAIIIVISLLFSLVIYVIASNELIARIDDWQTTPYYASRFFDYREQQIHQVEANLVGSLGLANVVIWTLGGIGSYYLARKTLQPIEKSHEAQSRFTSDASHELRTPLASMKTEIEVALRDPQATTTELRELLASNLEEVNKLAQLSHTLLQLSRQEHATLVKEKVSLHDVIIQAGRRYDPKHTRLDIKGDNPPAVLANRASLEELAAILLDNALKYSPPNSPVSIRLLNKKHMSGFEVINSGEGIAAETLAHIFERFYRVDSARSRNHAHGYGLGLSLAKKIVELHNGELSVTSGEHADTVFRVWLHHFKPRRVQPTANYGIVKTDAN